MIFAYRRSVAWLRANGYGWAVSEVTGRFDTGADSMMLMLEYVDEECACLCVAGYVDGYNYLYGGSPYVNQGVTGMKAVLLECVETEGVMTASVPTRLTLNRPGGQFDAMIGMYYAQAKLMALEVLAVEKGVFPDVYLGVARRRTRPVHRRPVRRAHRPGEHRRGRRDPRAGEQPWLHDPADDRPPGARPACHGGHPR